MIDEQLEKKLFSLVSALRKEIGEFMSCIQQDDIMAKEEKTTAVYDTIVSLRSDAEIIIKDLEREDLQRNFYLFDKHKQLGRIRDNITTLIDIFDENPNITDYKEGLLKTVIDDINSVIQEVNAIVADDRALQQKL